MGLLKHVATLHMFRPGIPGWDRAAEREILRRCLPVVDTDEPDDEQRRLFEPATDAPIFERKPL